MNNYILKVLGQLDYQTFTSEFDSHWVPCVTSKQKA